MEERQMKDYYAIKDIFGKQSIRPLSLSKGRGIKFSTTELKIN